MTKAEETQLHNLFIKFKNEGKSLDEIGELLAIDIETLSKWDRSFEEETSKINSNKPPIAQSDITGIDDSGNYQYSHSISFNLSQLEGAKFTLQRIIWGIENNQPENEFQIKAKKYLPVFENYFSDINMSFNQETQQISFKYNLNSDDEEVKKNADEAVRFYGQVYAIESVVNNSRLIQNVSTDIFTNTQNILPYGLKRFIVKNYEGINYIEIQEPFPIDTNWIFLIGENGFGKTSILRSITIGLIGERDEEAPLFTQSVENGIGIEYFNLNKSIIHNIGFNIERFPHLACYGPSRLQIQTDQTQNDVAKKSTTTYSLFNSDGILLNIEFELLIWFLEKSHKFENVKQTFLRLIPYLSDIEVNVPSRKVYYIEKEPTEEGDIYTPVLFEQLASGFRSIIAMVGDIIIRLFKSQPEITNPSELAGIVIIDELDLHWHPKMQREIPQLLSQIFPKIQFIVSTHSLVPLLGAPENSVLLKVNRTKEEGITVEKIDIDFQALSSDKMLRDIFDLEKYMSDAKQQAWERYTRLKSLIHFEKDETKKLEYIEEREQLGDKYKFGL
ncbi:AAA family ATPase [Runella limosa]|uniref:AAA family ATPase n=1 Tax=Runella limosa TaxID=370978 RepID=UPI00042617DF|nr:AAA family ATPase [Runella limosa]